MRRLHWDNREAEAFRYKGWLGLGDATEKTWQILVCVMAGWRCSRGRVRKDQRVEEVPPAGSTLKKYLSEDAHQDASEPFPN